MNWELSEGHRGPQLPHQKNYDSSQHLANLQFSQANLHYHPALYGLNHHHPQIPLTSSSSTSSPTTTPTPNNNNIINSNSSIINVSNQQSPYHHHIISSSSSEHHHHHQQQQQQQTSGISQPQPISPISTSISSTPPSTTTTTSVNHLPPPPVHHPHPHGNIPPPPVHHNIPVNVPIAQHPHQHLHPPPQGSPQGIHLPHHPHHNLPPPFHLKSPLPGTSSSGPPVPHTPQGAPTSGNPFSPGGTEHDLHPELLALGWRKFWSKRENRFYFWNSTNGQSLWEPPPLPGHISGPPSSHPPGTTGHQMYDPLTDPLGINAPSAGHLGVKRRVSSGENPGNLAVKKFILGGPWDLEISSNVYVPDVSHPQKHLLPPHPETEQLRAQLVAKLRQCYQTACHSRESIDAPKESLNRWFVEQKVTELRGMDPLFSSCENPEGQVSNNMLKEIMHDIPMKITKARFTGDARKQLSKFAEACKRTVETRNSSNEARKIVKWKVEETFTWLRGNQGISYDLLLERLQHLRITCQPHVHSAAKASVEGICKKISVLSKQYAQNTKDAHLKFFVEPENVKVEPEGEKGRFRCYPIQCGNYQYSEAGRLPTVDFVQQREFAILKFKNDAVRISTQYLQKLEQLYRYNCIDDRKFEFFLVRSFCLLKRYNAYCDDFASCQSTQASLPVTVFETIQRNFGVTFECFASPFNCYFRQYCSAFPDLDGYYGSRGTFLDFHPVSGSFEMNPPFQEDLIIAAISHAEDLLAGTREPMSFIIFLPEFSEERDDWGVVNNKNEWLKRVESSRWKRKQVTITPYEHEGRHPSQHNVLKSEHIIRIHHATVIFWLQNDAGFEEWKPTDQRVDALIDSYRPGRERERDRSELLAPERQMPHQADKILVATAASSTVVST